MKALTQAMQQTKETKGTYRYDVTPHDPAAPFTCLYIRKGALEGEEVPRVINVTVKWEEQ